MTAALACFFVAEIEENEKRRRWLMAGFYAAVGASLLAKGLVGIVIPFGVVGLYYLMRREWPRQSVAVSAALGNPSGVRGRGHLVCSRDCAARMDFRGRVFHPTSFRALRLEQVSPPARLLFLPAHHADADAAVDGRFSSRGSLSAALEMARAERGKQSHASSLLAWLVAPVALLFFFRIEAARIHSARAARRDAVGRRASDEIRARKRKATGAMRFTGAILLVLALAGIIYAARTREITILCALVIAAPLIIAGALGNSLEAKARTPLGVNLQCDVYLGRLDTQLRR